MKVYLLNCETQPGDSHQHQTETLRFLWQNSSMLHELVESPEDADIIIVGNIKTDNGAWALRTNPVVKKHVEKCFAVSEDYSLLPLLRGIYVNAHSRLPFKKRFRTGCYALFYPEFKNPFVEAYAGHAFNEPKQYLASFCGRNCHPSRNALCHTKWRRDDVLITDTSDYNAFTWSAGGKSARQQSYLETLIASKFSISPRGAGAASLRLFESMKLGVAPVIISDNWIFPVGPNWDTFAVILPESNLCRLEQILAAKENQFEEMGRLAQAAFEEFFSEKAYFDYIIEQFLSIQRSQKISERVYWNLRNFMLFAGKTRSFLKNPLHK